MSPQNHVVRTLYPVARSQLGALLLPILAMAGLFYGLWDLERNIAGPNVDIDIPLLYWAVCIGVPLAFLLWGLVKPRFTARYQITMDSVVVANGLLRRNASELRLGTVRHIEVQQSVLGRLLMWGDVVFATEREGGTRLTFARVGHPKQVKQFVDDLLARRRSAALPQVSDPTVEDVVGQEPESVPATADRKNKADKSKPPETTTPPETITPPERSTQPMTGAKKGDAGGGDDRDELYRLLAEQEADGQADDEGEA